MGALTPVHKYTDLCVLNTVCTVCGQVTHNYILGHYSLVRVLGFIAPSWPHI